MLGKETCLEKRAQINFSARTQMAMEFAKTAAAGIAGADDSWLPEGTRSFLLAGARAAGQEKRCVYC
jgi:hypothetical protein